MKLRKDKWKYQKLNKIMSFKNGFNFNKGSLKNGWKVLGVSDFQDFFYPSYHQLETLVADRLPSKDYLVENNDVLFVRSNGNKDLVGRTLLIKDPPFPITFSAFCIRGRFINSEVDPLFFTFLSKSDLFKSAMRKLVQGTNITNVSQGLLTQLEIPIPSVEEQKEIVSLFQSIDATIDYVNEQHKNLKSLWLRLIDDLVSAEAKFGNLLKGKNLTPVRYSQVAEKIMRRIDPIMYNVERIVGGENLESEDLKIRTWGTVGKDALGPAFHVLFEKGDILYGSRRTYLKKVSYADFVGVCANTTYVIRAKEKMLLQDLLKYIMLSNQFTQYSISVSKGSTNPYINWKDLDGFTFQLPDLTTQAEIASILDSILDVIEQLLYQKDALRLLKKKLLQEILG
jgi:type I restriction enzyme S subunit